MSQHSFQATPLAPDLTFINVTNSKSLSKKSKEVVRGHVTRRVFQERRYRKQGHEVANVSRARASITCDDDHEEGEETEKSTTGNGSAKAITFKAYRPPKKPSLSVLQPSPTLLDRREYSPCPVFLNQSCLFQILIFSSSDIHLRTITLQSKYSKRNRPHVVPLPG